MLQYLIILLDDTSTSFCHYENKLTKRNLVPLETLKTGIRFGMMENLMIQFVFPDYELPQEYKKAIESIDHSKIVSSLCGDKQLVTEADVVVYHDWSGLSFGQFTEDMCVVLRTSKADLFERFLFLQDVLSKVARLNIVITDVESFIDEDFEKYKNVLQSLSDHLGTLYVEGTYQQLNLLTDRMLLKEMHNCGAGDSSITLAPNGKYYICPAFYFDNSDDSVGNLNQGLDIKNKQLYRLDHAPICNHCDAWHCKRCIWLNRKTTLEVNTPSHEQCVLAHLERNASRILMKNLRSKGTFLPNQEEIKEIDYLDPFDKRDEWI